MKKLTIILITLLISSICFSQYIDRNGQIITLGKTVLRTRANAPGPVGSGNILILNAGQSNASGRGDSTDIASFNLYNNNDSVNVWNGSFETLSAYSNNQYPEIERQDKFGYIQSIHNNLSNYDTTYIVNYAIGGTSVYEGSSAYDWNVNSVGKSYDGFINIINTAVASGINYNRVVFVWYQGEQDAGNETYANAYESNLNDLLDSIETNITINDILLVRINAPSATYRTTVRGVQSKIASERSNTTLINVDAYPLQDVVHLTSQACIDFGLYLSTLINNL